MLASRRTATRRAVLAGCGAVLLAGCDLDPTAETEPTPAPTSGAPPDPSVEADLALLDKVRANVELMRGQVSLTWNTYPALRKQLAPLGRLHRTHLRELDAAGGTKPRVSSMPVTSDGPRAALDAVRAMEQSHQRLLARSCVQSASGSLARMLASMSAGVAAHLAALPEDVS